jgi:uncharacterized protein YcbK (DUF882 family)|tara:strand:- start:284 stop:691 length:408 start_codon:yes stop_codon:yes gene_type:complete
MLFGFYMANKYLTKNFTYNELKCRGTGICDMSPSFLERLQLIRDDFGRPLNPSSGFRAPEWNEKVSSTGRTGPHTTGHAVDIQIFGAEALELIKIAQAHGITGIGFKLHGPRGKRFIHLDDLTAPHPRPNSWSYT